MKTRLLLAFILVFCANIKLSAFSGGSGNSGDPYLVSTPADLAELAGNSTYWTNYFKQTTDIALSNCYSGANISTSSGLASSIVGGIIGTAPYGTIENCYATGSVTNVTGIAGGLLGQAGTLLASTTSINYCYSTGLVSGATRGGFIGKFQFGSFTDCYFDYNSAGTSVVCGSGSPTGITAKTTGDMQTASTIGSWSSSYWYIADGGYPKLLWQLPKTQASLVTLHSDAEGAMLTIGWTNGSGSNRAVFMKQGTGAITNPTDGATYTASTNWSSKGTQLASSGYYCIYNGTGNSVAVTNAIANTQYTLQVFEYNGVGSSSIFNASTATGNPHVASSLPVEFIFLTASSSANKVKLN